MLLMGKSTINCHFQYFFVCLPEGMLQPMVTLGMVVGFTTSKLIGDRTTSAKDPPSTIEFCRYGPTKSGKCHEITLIKYPLVI